MMEGKTTILPVKKHKKREVFEKHFYDSPKKSQELTLEKLIALRDARIRLSKTG